MNRRSLVIACLPALLVAAAATGQQPSDRELSQVKEQELVELRAQISDLKISMDERAEERDRVTAELQSAEVQISEKRIKLKELARQKDYSERRKAELDASIVRRQAELEAESGQLADQVRAAYMSGSQERIKLLLNQQDPAALGRQLKYYEYFSRFRDANIDSVTRHLEELGALQAEAAAAESTVG